MDWALIDILMAGLSVFAVIAALLLAVPALKARLSKLKPMALSPGIAVSVPAKPSRQLSSSPILSARAQFAALTSVVAGRMSSTEDVIRAQATAREKLDATELSLRRLVADMSDVMSPVVMTSLGPPALQTRAQLIAPSMAA